MLIRSLLAKITLCIIVMEALGAFFIRRVITIKV